MIGLEDQHKSHGTTYQDLTSRHAPMVVEKETLATKVEEFYTEALAAPLRLPLKNYLN